MAASTSGSPTARESGARARDESASVVLEPPVRGKSRLRVRDPDRRPALHLPPLPLCLTTKGSTSTGGTASHLWMISLCARIVVVIHGMTRIALGNSLETLFSLYYWRSACLAWWCKIQDKVLPTEEQWQHAAEGKNGNGYPWGSAPPGAQACWNGANNSVGKGARRGPCAVGAFPKGDTAMCQGPRRQCSRMDPKLGSKPIRIVPDSCAQAFIRVTSNRPSPDRCRRCHPRRHTF